jgi:hypothetical protein
VPPRARTLAFWILFALLVAIRLPSITQPAGGDQGLYAYVGQRILDGELPYRNAWDQKPPGIHFTYAVLWAAWPDERVVAVADFIVCVLNAWLLLLLGRRLGPPGTGEVAALAFLLFANPAWGRLGGVRVRAQCEVFIGLAATAALLLLHRGVLDGRPRVRGACMAGAGALVGVAFVYKYNAGSVLAVAALASGLWLRAATPGEARTRWWQSWIASLVWLGAGFGAVVALLLAVFAAGDALTDLYHATITYNVFYSGETYAGRVAWLRYLLTFPIAHARVDALWFLGGLGALSALSVAAWSAWPGTQKRKHPPDPISGVVAAAWIAAACLSIAVNGGRGLPQYFIQANPALALAFGVAAATWWVRTGPRTRLLAAVALVVAVARIGNAGKVIDYTAWDLRAWTGSLSRDEYLARFGERGTGDKYSALANRELAAYLGANSGPDETVLVFGFSPGALVQADRRSATRFFWSRPIIVGFGDGWPGYGVRGLYDELIRHRPALVVLQRRDWDPDTLDSYTFFLGRPELRGWLEREYTFVEDLGNYAIWRHRPPRP